MANGTSSSPIVPLDSNDGQVKADKEGIIRSVWYWINGVADKQMGL